MIKSKIERSVSNDLWGSIYSDRLGSVSSGQVGVSFDGISTHSLETILRGLILICCPNADVK
jgi:hypothetical protein